MKNSKLKALNKRNLSLIGNPLVNNMVTSPLLPTQKPLINEQPSLVIPSFNYNSTQVTSQGSRLQRERSAWQKNTAAPRAKVLKTNDKEEPFKPAKQRTVNKQCSGRIAPKLEDSR